MTFTPTAWRAFLAQFPERP
ncbi:hypothetical protein E0H26_10415 [Micromonospora zingiberis]|uniref:Uncharacterized protein n=1 Tax=Micromonospora zingiberis TaxID=2053011 RepID=A0A4R0GR64_9ACTN|nr:hypothetical protein E0H26_10415 [Micromonospora zingiberis]